MLIEIYQDSTIEARIYDNKNQLRTIIPQYDILGLPNLSTISSQAFIRYLSSCYTRLSRTSDGTYLLRLHPKLKGGGGFDFILGALMVAGGTALTVFTGGLASVPGTAMAAGGIKGCIHAYNNYDENFGDQYFESIFVGSVTGVVTGGIGALGPAAGSMATALTGFKAASTAATIGVNMAGSVVATATEAVFEGKEIKGVDLITSAVVSSVASGVQCFQADTIVEVANKGREATAAFSSSTSVLKDKLGAKISEKTAARLSKVVAEKTLKECIGEVGSTAATAFRANTQTMIEISKAPLAATTVGVIIGGAAGAMNDGKNGAIRGAVKVGAQGLVAGLAAQTQGSLSNNLNGLIVPLSTAAITLTMDNQREQKTNRELTNEIRDRNTSLEASQATLRQAQLQRNADLADLTEARDRLVRQEIVNKTLETKLEQKSANNRPVAEEKEFENRIIPSSDVSQLIRRRR
jgi:hypothetical protein